MPSFIASEIGICVFVDKRLLALESAFIDFGSKSTAAAALEGITTNMMWCFESVPMISARDAKVWLRQTSHKFMFFTRQQPRNSLHSCDCEGNFKLNHLDGYKKVYFPQPFIFQFQLRRCRKMTWQSYARLCAVNLGIKGWLPYTRALLAICQQSC